MIPLSARDVAEFRELYRRETGRELPPAKARHVAECLVELIARLDRFDAGRPHLLPPSV